MDADAQKRLLVTGGSGLLGRHIRELLPEALYPSSAEFDVRDNGMMDAYLAQRSIATILHCAAVTSPPRVDKEPLLALEVNVVGTANLVRLCARGGMRLIYISTDYVFDGERGNYREADPVRPMNRYAWSKLGGETAVRMLESGLIVRLSFGPEPFPYEKAFVDQWTSREPVSLSASKIVRLVESDLSGVIHIGSPRRTVMEYAKSIRTEKVPAPLRRNEVSFAAPKDTSLDTTKYDSHFGSTIPRGHNE